MADIRLAKPAAGTTQTVPSAPDGRFIFDFPADAATLTRNGDDLVLTFEDGAAIQLQGFYTTYSKEEMPSFQVDGVEISGQDFFAALDEDLMPAAGPASGSSAARGGRYNEYGGSDLLDGLDHLGRLDIGFDGGTQLATDTVEPSPYSEVDHGVTVTPSGVGAATEVVTVYEAGLEGGSQAGEKDAPTMAGGSLSINAPDGVASIVIGGVVVFENGALTGKVVSTDEGTLSVTGYDPATGKLDFSYRLDRNTTEHVKSDPDTDTQISHTLVVTVTDTDGDSGSTTITVNVVDDMPEARADSISFTEAAAQEGASGKSVLENDVFGADAPAYKTVTSIEGGALGQPVQGDYGTLTLNEDGTYTYKLGDKVDVPKGETYTEQFTYTIKDADGDTSTATLTIAIRGDEKEPVAPGEDKAEIVVDEGALSDGSGQHAEHGILGKDSFTVNLNGEDGTITLKYGTGENSSITLSLINGDTFDEKWLSPNTTLTVNGVEVTVTGATQTEPGGPWKIEYTYKLTGQQTHDNVGSAGAVGADDALSDSIDITVTDATGDMTTGSLTVTVHDDGPVLTVSSDPTDTLKWTGGAAGAYTTERGSLTLKTGADGLKEGSLQVTGDAGNNATFDAEGKATINYEDGSKLEAAYVAFTGKISYTYTPGAGTETTDRSFTFSALDTDDDSASATVSIKVDLADSGDVPATVPSIEVDESGLADGTMPDPDMITKPITLPEGYTLNTEGWSDGGDGALTYSVNEGKGLLTYKDGKLTYTLQDNYDHANPAQDNEGLADGSKPTFDLSLTHDATGVKVSTTVTVDVLDDAPVLTAKIDTQPSNDTGYYYDTDAAIVFRLAEGGPTTKLSDIDFGADVGTGEEGSAPARITVTVNDTEFTVTVTRDAEGKLLFNGENTGTITFEKKGADDGSALTYDTATGKFTYTRPTADVGGAADNYTFTLTVTDADGDTVQQTGSVTTKTVAPTISLTDANIIVDEGALAHGSQQHTNDGFAGTKAFTVNLHGEDGTIILSADGGNKITLEVKDGALEIPQNATITVNGVTISALTAQKADDGTSWTVSYDYELTKQQTHTTPNSSNYHEDGKSADLTISVTSQSGQTVTGTLPVTVHDDGPQFTADSTNFTSVDTDTDQYWSHEGEISFTEKTYWNDIKDPQGSIVHVDEQNSVTISIGNVYFADDRKEIPTTDIDQIKTGDGTFFLSENGLGITSWINEDGVDGTLYYEHNITNTQRLQEICYDYANNRSEAVVIELGKTALNMDISLKSFFGGTSEGTEKAIFLFYKDGQLIDTATLSSNSSSGNVTGDHLLVDQPDGFDTVVIAAMHNGVSTDVTQDNSDFAIGALTFNKFDGAIKTLNGRLDATSADGIRSYQIDIEGLSQCGLTYGEQAITYSRDGDKILAKAGDMLIFDITLNEQSGAWVMAQYQDYEGNLALSFTATDGDGDTATLKIPVDSSPSATTLKAEVEARSTMHGVEAMATAAALAGMATVLPDEVPAAEGERPDTPDETLVAAPAEAADAPAALSFVEEGAALPDSPVDGMDDTPLLFANLALAGQEELMVSAVQTDAADGPLWADASGTDDTSGTVVGETATAGPGAAHPGTAAPEAVLHGTDADDILLGGDGDELIFGGSGDDFIDGGEGRDTIYAGDGNDIIVYDQQDYLVSGGSGIDFMVSDDSTLSLTKLLQGTGDGNGPIVDSIEVLITGTNALSLTSLEQMAKDYGISINGSSLELDSTLWAKADNGYQFTGGQDDGGDLFLQVNSRTDAQVSVELVQSDDIAEAVQRAEIEHSNG